MVVKRCFRQIAIIVCLGLVVFWFSCGDGGAQSDNGSGAVSVQESGYTVNAAD